MAEKTKDTDAPPSITLEIRGPGGEAWGTIVASARRLARNAVFRL